MRVLLVGIGGAGCRIADTIHAFDQKSRALRCTDGIAFDSDADTLTGLRALPQNQAIYAQALDLHDDKTAPHAFPDDEVITRLQSLDPGDIDALFICCGLGGSMAGHAPSLIQRIREGMVEPVFGICTLPCSREGEEVAARAANQIDALLPALDAMILFDNEIWYERMKDDHEPEHESSEIDLVLSRVRPAVPQPAVARRYAGINRMIATRVGLLLRAGEVSEQPGAEVGEVALDAGEIVNTLRGMGLAAIGYARDVVPPLQPDLIRRLRPAGHSVQGSHESASRIVTLGKRAVSQEMSISCELARAEKALVLIAGPPHDMSMRGYMAIRHWIDRSIRGVEVRAGDYPVSGSRFVAVIVLLSGLTDIARVQELRSIRDRKITEQPLFPGQGE